MYRAVGNLCAVNFSELELPISEREAMGMLSQLGFQKVDASFSEIAMSVVGKNYRKTARFAEAPNVFNCSSLPKWVYAQCGIWIPRWAIQQFRFGTQVDLDDLKQGDIIFSAGFTPSYEDDITIGVGHSMLALGNGLIVHATSRIGCVGIYTDSLEQISSNNGYRGIRRIIADWERIVTFRIPETIEVETSDDIKWIIYQNLL